VQIDASVQIEVTPGLRRQKLRQIWHCVTVANVDVVRAGTL